MLRLQKRCSWSKISLQNYRIPCILLLRPEIFHKRRWIYYKSTISVTGVHLMVGRQVLTSSAGTSVLLKVSSVVAPTAGRSEEIGSGYPCLLYSSMNPRIDLTVTDSYLRPVKLPILTPSWHRLQSFVL